jgi:hypothetical protein
MALEVWTRQQFNLFYLYTYHLFTWTLTRNFTKCDNVQTNTPGGGTVAHTRGHSARKHTR